MGGYNGHKNYNAWNVSLWLFNDEPLYREMRRVVSSSRTLSRATDRLTAVLPSHTPDGVAFTKTNVRLALRHWDK